MYIYPIIEISKNANESAKIILVNSFKSFDDAKKHVSYPFKTSKVIDKDKFLILTKDWNLEIINAGEIHLLTNDDKKYFRIITEIKVL
ncbi:hypothetical protein [Spiroplasma endosymbiont of Atherix ibis]|uniref:hypothetical protein n=1 Tax=Spiroplasma endosymbiont of Atherix ibis TaxID=3066291 RepID=UPI0030D495BF